MINTKKNNKQIAHNTLLLYLRTFFIMGISLYTSRIILNILGIENYGIYNIIGGVVAMFSAVSSTLSSSISRFITYELGTNNLEKLRKVFSTSLNIQLLISLIIITVGETIGVWFINNRIQIPIERLTAANWVFQCSLLTFVINLISIPYNACIIAHEKMSAFAYISILEVILKLAIVYSLLISPFDKLITYSILLTIVSILIRFTYSTYCKRNFSECNYHFILEKSLFKDMLSFVGWSFLGNSSYIFNTQGINILINIFFGVTLNAGRGIATQVEGAILQFVNNFTMAINPQITKSYASNEKSYMFLLICQGSKYSYILLLFFVIPFFLEAENILNIWLKTVPPYSSIFVQYSCLCLLITALGNSMITAISATGNIRNYHLYITTISIFIFPLTFIAYKNGIDAYIAYVIYFFIYIILLFVRLKILNNLTGFPVKMFISKTLIKIAQVTFISIIIPIVIKECLETSHFRIILVIISSSFSIIASTYFIGLEYSEKKNIQNKIKAKLASYTKIH